MLGCFGVSIIHWNTVKALTLLVHAGMFWCFHNPLNTVKTLTLLAHVGLFWCFHNPLKHCEGSDTISACWDVLVFPWSTETLWLWRLWHFQCILGCFGVSIIHWNTVKALTLLVHAGLFGCFHNPLKHCEDSDTFSACWDVLVFL